MKESQEKLSIYEEMRSVPENALKEIKKGPLKGKSVINPMWRIKKLTETFGPAGLGWYTEITDRWTEQSPDGERAAFVNISLRVKVGEEWSKPIPGTGGSRVIVRDTELVDGKPAFMLRADDEAYKKAYTDAIGVACKALGMGADVYWNADTTKYTPVCGTDDGGKETKEDDCIAIMQQKRSCLGKDDDAAKEKNTEKENVRMKLTPQNPSWRKVVTYTAKQKEGRDVLTERLKSKWDITDSDCDLLMQQAGKNIQ